MSICRPLLASALLSVALAACGGGASSGQGNGMFGTAGATKGDVASAPPVALDNMAGQAGGTAQPGDAANATAQPVAGSAQRAALMNALRPAIERELGGPVEFVVSRAVVQDGWALVIADPQRPGGGAITPPAGFDTEFRDGLTVNGVLRFSGNGWTLVDYAVGPTDVWYCGLQGPPPGAFGC